MNVKVLAETISDLGIDMMQAGDSLLRYSTANQVLILQEIHDQLKDAVGYVRDSICALDASINDSDFELDI